MKMQDYLKTFETKSPDNINEANVNEGKIPFEFMNAFQQRDGNNGIIKKYLIIR